MPTVQIGRSVVPGLSTERRTVRTQRGLATVGGLSVMMIASAIPAGAVPSVGPVPPGGPTVVRSALAWGSNHFGQVGDGTIAGRQTSPVRPFGLGSGVSQVAAGQEFTLAMQNGTVLAWGTNSDGQLGDGTLDGHLIPTPVPALTNVTRLSAGLAHSLALALRSDGTVWTWGDNSTRALGDGTLNDRIRPVKVPGLVNVAQVAAGAWHSMAVRSDGVAFGWGANAAGQLGDGTLSSRVVPGRVTFLTGVTRIAAGAESTLALSNGRPHWRGRRCGAGRGGQLLGQLADGTATHRRDPVPVLAASGSVQVDAGGNHTVVVVERPLVVGP